MNFKWRQLHYILLKHLVNIKNDPRVKNLVCTSVDKFAVNF